TQPSQRLRGEGTLHWMKVLGNVAAVDRSRNAGISNRDQKVKRPAKIDRYRTLADGTIRITEVPCEFVLITEDVAACAGRFAVARSARVIQHQTAVDHRCRLGIWKRQRSNLPVRAQINHLHGIIEAGHHIEKPTSFIQREAACSSAADG